MDEILSRYSFASLDVKGLAALESAKQCYVDGNREDALLRFVKLYMETGEADINTFICEVYYEDKKAEYNEQYRKNCELLKTYPHFYGKWNKDILYYPLFVSEKYLWYFDSTAKMTRRFERSRFSMDSPQDVVALGSHLLWMEDILCLEEMTKKQNPFMDLENPLLLIYQGELWDLFVQLHDLAALVKKDRILFYNDVSQLKESLLEKGVRFPTVIFGEYVEDISFVVNETREEYKRRYAAYRQQALDYYNTSEEAIVRNIKAKKPKILFITTRFSTALQYHIRDCKAAADDLGLKTELDIEKDRLRTGSGELFFMKKLVEFQPDIIFILDHFRYEWQDVLEGIESVVWVCWVQDSLPHIMSGEAVSKQGKRDIVITHFAGWERFQMVGYNKERIIPYPLVANHKLYQPYILSEIEKLNYGCDICMVCHYTPADHYAEGVGKEMDDDDREFICRLYQSYIEYVRDTDDIFVRADEYKQYINAFTKENYGCSLGEKEMEFLLDSMGVYLHNILYRERLANWLIDAGYTNIKLWGNGWNKVEKFRPYAMGPAKNGELLSKILQASKIVIGNNGSTTGASRVPETMLSGGFYMSNDVSQDVDTSDIRQYLKEDEELVFFRDKEDFLGKIAYYLGHDEKRIRMAEIGHKKALELLTYERFMEHVLSELADMF